MVVLLLSSDIGLAMSSGYLEFRGEMSPEDRNLGVMNIWVRFKAFRLDKKARR